MLDVYYAAVDRRPLHLLREVLGGLKLTIYGWNSWIISRVDRVDSLQQRTLLLTMVMSVVHLVSKSF